MAEAVRDLPCVLAEAASTPSVRREAVHHVIHASHARWPSTAVQRPVHMLGQSQEPARLVRKRVNVCRGPLPWGVLEKSGSCLGAGDMGGILASLSQLTVVWTCNPY